MANKLLKHFGFTGKKVSSQQSPSHEYPTKTSSSIQELHSRTPAKTRSNTNVVPRGSSASSPSAAYVRPDADGRRHSDASAVHASLPSARSAARSRVGGSPGVGWSLTRSDNDSRTTGPSDSATIASSSVRSRRPPRIGSMTQDDTKKSCDHTDVSCPVRLQVTSVSSDNLTPRILDEYSDPFDVKKELEQVSKDEVATESETRFLNAVKDTPQASEDDYSVPYELKNLVGESEQPESECSSETAAVPKYDDPYAEAPVRFRSHSAVEASRNEVEPTVLSSSFADSVASDGKLCPGSDGKEPSRHVSESSTSLVPMLNGEGTNENNNGSTIDIAHSSPTEVDSSDTYDEPWDLRAARLGLENRLRAAQTSSQAATSIPHVSTRYDSRYKTMDPRPAMEYDEPWDRRAKDVQRSLISAKSAKEEARVLRESHGAASHLPVFSSSTCCRLPDSSRHDRSSSKHAADLPCIHLSSAMKHQCSSFDSDIHPWRTVAERIDPKLPLGQQTWYHGSISRLDAEALLRVHREGSYLVRMSESNRCDYSLSLKSPRGFMHMKIVSCEDGGGCGGGHYILGQFSQPFDSIPQMIHHYTINKLPIKGAEHMSLLHPVNNELL